MGASARGLIDCQGSGAPRWARASLDGPGTDAWLYLVRLGLQPARMCVSARWHTAMLSSQGWVTGGGTPAYDIALGGGEAPRVAGQVKEEAQVESIVRWVDSGGEAGGKRGWRGWETGQGTGTDAEWSLLWGELCSSECGRSVMLCSGRGRLQSGTAELEGGPRHTAG